MQLAADRLGISLHVHYLMNIYLTNKANVRNTNFCNSDGQILYKSETSGSTFNPHKITTIGKVVPNASPELFEIGVRRI